VWNQSTDVFFYNKASLFYTKNATHLKCQNLDIHAYAVYFLSYITICMLTTWGNYNVWNMSMVFKRQKQDQSIRKRICEPWLDKHSQMKQEILKYWRWLVSTVR